MSLDCVLTMMTIMSSDAVKQTWSVAEAKARFSEVVLRARAGEPQHVSRYGKDEVVVVSIDDWNAMSVRDNAKAKPRGSLLDLFEPLRGSGLVLERAPGGARTPPFGDED